jgi:replicative DNA helicase
MTNKVEEAIIAILMSKDTHKELFPMLNIELFNSEITIAAFKTIKIIIDQGRTPNAINFFQSAKANNLSAQDIAKIISWTNSLTYNEPINEYIAILKDFNIKKSINGILNEEIIGFNENVDGYTTAQSIIKRLTNLLDTESKTDNIIDLQSLTAEERHAYYRRAQLAESGQTTGVNTGLNSINKFTGGFHPEFIIIAGRPSMGKTALALFHGMQSKEPGIYFNLEMNKSQLCQRLILQHANQEINSSRLRDGTMAKDELKTFETIIGKIEHEPFLIYDKARCGVHEAIRVIKKEHRKGRCKWAIIDYLQLMTIEGFKGGNREAEVAEISRTLKAAQKELGIPIIALAQLSREVEKRPDKKPVLSDLRESGSLEQDADTVAFVYRPAYYGLSDDNGNPYTNEIFYLFEKHRQGATGVVEFRHSSNMSNFMDAQQYESSNNKINNNLSNYVDTDLWK